MDNTWLRHFTPEVNRKSLKWTAYEGSNLKCGQRQQSVSKIPLRSPKKGKPSKVSIINCLKDNFLD